MKNTKKVATTKTVANKAKSQKATKASAKAAPAKVAKTVAEKPAVHTCSKCKKPERFDYPGTGDKKGQLVSSFSYVEATGKPRPICKPCQTEKANEWTSRPEVAEMRKDQARARQFINLGIPAAIPTAKTWVKGAPLMTLEYYEKDGALVSADTKGAIFHKSVNADKLYETLKAEQAKAREAEKAEQKLIADKAKEVRASERQATRDAKLVEKTKKAEALLAERKEAKEKRDLEKANKAIQAKAEREAEQAKKALARQAQAVTRAQEAKEAKDKKALKKAEEAKQASIVKAQEASSKKSAKDTDAVSTALKNMAQSVA